VLLAEPTREDREALVRCLLPGDAASAGYCARVRGLCAAFSSLRAALPAEAWFASCDFLYLARQLAAAADASGGPRGHFDGAALAAALGRNFQCVDSGAFPALVAHFVGHLAAAAAAAGVGEAFEVPEGAAAARSVEHLRAALQRRVGPGAWPAADAGAGGGAAAAADTCSRHVLLVDRTRGEVALDFLRSELGDGLVVVALSDFAEDSSVARVTEALARVEAAVSYGKTLAIVNSGRLQSSLYALLNRHYHVQRSRQTGRDEQYVTMAIGSLSRPVRVHPAARVIVHLPARELPATPLPFLNRFEVRLSD
jgi:hypothetical protein